MVPRSLSVPDVPEALLSAPRTPVDEAAQFQVGKKVPLYEYHHLFPEIKILEQNDSRWVTRLLVKPLLGRVFHRMDRSKAASAGVPRITPITRKHVSAEELTTALKERAAQRYGLPAVLEEFSLTGKVLGVHSDELEGYDWPLDGRHYGPREKPKVATAPEFLHMTGWLHEPDRVEPPDDPAATLGKYSPRTADPTS
jgi:hypothetical protein